MSAIYKIIDKKKLDIVNRPISKAHGLPNECYTSKDYTLIEREKIFENKWTVIGVASSLPNIGDVKPPALDEFIRITKNKGLICFTINEGIYEEYGFDKKIKQLKNENKWKEIEFFKSDYIASKDVNAWLGLYEVTK